VGFQKKTFLDKNFKPSKIIEIISFSIVYSREIFKTFEDVWTTAGAFIEKIMHS